MDALYKLENEVMQLICAENLTYSLKTHVLQSPQK